LGDTGLSGSSGQNHHVIAGWGKESKKEKAVVAGWCGRLEKWWNFCTQTRGREQEYFGKNLHRMEYPEYEAEGWQIGSGGGGECLQDGSGSAAERSGYALE
jgi:hypothetical protein